MVNQTRLAEVFVQLADTLVYEFDVIDLLHTLVEASVELLDADAAGLMLADQHGALQVIAHTSERIRRLEVYELDHDQGPCLEAYRTGQGITNVDSFAVARRWPVFNREIRRMGFSTVHALPLRLRDQVIGAMNLYLTRVGNLSEQDIALARGMADMATIGLLQQRALADQHILSEQLQGALNSRVLIEQAKGVLAERHRMDTTTAFTTMRAHARATHQTLQDVAQDVINGMPLPTT